METDHRPDIFAPGSRHGRQIEAFVLAAVFVLVNLAGALLQKPVSSNQGRPWEGAPYCAVAEQFAAGQSPVVADAPEVYRVGTPFLVGTLLRWTGWELFQCFKVVNGTANALTLALLVCWLRRYIADWRIRVALGLAFLVQWDTPVRWMYFFPAHTDPWMWVFLLAGLLAVERHRDQPTPARLALITVLTALGVCFREVVLVIACVLPFAGNPLPTANLGTVLVRSGWRTIGGRVASMFLPRGIPLAAGILVLAAVRSLMAVQDNPYSFGLTAVHWIYEKPWPTYLHGWFLAFGPILWLAILQFRKLGPFFAVHQHLAVYLLAFAVLGYIGGTDTERLLYWSMPVTYVLIGRGLEDRWWSLSGPMLAFMTLAQAIADRAAFWPIPDYPNNAPRVWPVFTPFAGHVPFMDLYGFWESRLLALTSLLTYFAFGAVLTAWLAWQQNRPRDGARILPGAS